MTDYKMYLGGEWVQGDSTIAVLNPANEEIFATVPSASVEQVDRALEAARRAQVDWGRKTGVERGDVLRRWADLIDRDREMLARLLAQEVGKPLEEAIGEVNFGNDWLRYYAAYDRHIEGVICSADKPDEQMWILPQPVGVAVGIIAWNFPIAVALRKIAPALIAGNSLVLKPHEDTPITALELMKLAEEAGVPPGVCSVVTGPGATVGEALVRSSIPGVISFTGSVPTGKRIARLAADNVTTVSLEMGGKAPFIVLEDSDIEAAVDAAVFTRMLNCGQICIANERTYLHEDIADEFLDLFVAKIQKLKVGDPLQEGTDIGPKVSQIEVEKVDRFVQEAIQAGARPLTGGRRLQTGEYKKGFWYQPTVLVDVDQSMDIMRKEIFGPVVPVMKISSFSEAISLANDSSYGLAAYMFTNDMNRILSAVRDLECGELYINRGATESIHGYHAGWKDSGIGGDDGRYGLEHYMRRKTVYLKYRPS